ncbi:MAG: NACHT domain-containing protein [Haliscomenobacter sp.]|uniref:NACHT domain-containing protein n=1 Tax=Haliscomenobacter sp. TaxID=2717303 RepID=UPI0029B04292|nr:NACHT domain-containing protein [Haliscomenobacter sp.]MDX2067300.1 NACHT domain-containing protein [Haliscomenobacter sp.]
MFFKITNQQKLTHKQLLKTKRHLNAAKVAIRNAYLEEALKELQHLNDASFEEQISMLLIRLNKHDQENRLGTLTNEENIIGFNRISRDILGLIKTIEQGNNELSKAHRELRDYLLERYGNRLEQKLASHQPVNLRRFVSSEGTSDLIASTFVPFNHLEIRDEIGETFQDAHGRLLIIGQPGAGKITLLLQLAQRLMELEEDALPLILNLATWESSYTKLETWLEEIVTAELSINMASAKRIVNQTGLILLLDGLDELKEIEAMSSCLAAIAEYGAVAGRRFVITSRIEEYKQAQEDARVNLQIEVGPLSSEQLEKELERMSYTEPEARPLFLAIQNNPALKEIVKIPFYFNTLQLLFAGKIPTFRSNDVTGIHSEIMTIFTDYQLAKISELYSVEESQRWLAFLANRSNQHKKVDFELKDLQYDWWFSWMWMTRGVAYFCFGVVLGLDFGLVFGVLFMVFLTLILVITSEANFNGLGIMLALGPIVGLIIGLVSGIVIWLMLTLSSKSIPKIDTIEIVHRSFRVYWHYLKSFFIVLILTIAATLIFVLLFSSILPQMIGLAADTLTTLLYIALFFGVVIGLIYWRFFGLESLSKKESSEFIKISKPYQRFYASMKALHFSILRHWHLRLLLFWKGALPLKLVDFLNEMVTSKLMESDGATWRFRHRIIQDYFADLWIEPTPKNKKGRLQSVSAPKNT